ncbi:P-type ATPase [Rhizobium aegyptiacum]|uniref:P-type ATPase n=1 Tax=Rhizobium aegyptiacum TaxID=1764550 RepID=UPI0007E580E8|nr:hypothetical protein [Rhizobium aegyptiacum]
MWTTGTAIVFAVLVIDIGIGLHRKDFGLDLIAALAMGGAILFGEYLAGIVVALMFTGGQFLENFAQNRASREMTALLSRVPTRAARYEDGRIEDVAVSAIAPGDLILVRRGEVVAVDGIVAGNVAVLDESALTGETLPIRRQSGQAVMSGSTNAGDAFDLQATSAAAESTYAGVNRLVEAAQRTKAPIVRSAAKFGFAFLALVDCRFSLGTDRRDNPGSCRHRCGDALSADTRHTRRHRIRQTEAQLHEVQRLLHGLEAITRLHFAQEEEIYRSLAVE